MNHLRIIFLSCLFVAPLFLWSQLNRSIDGSNNNILNPSWGASHTPLSRITTIGYADGISAPGGQQRLNPREISNLLFDQEDVISDKLALSDFVWVLGQFIDHEISLTDNYSASFNPEESAIIIPPVGDPYFGQNEVIPMMRSLASPGTGTDASNPRQHDNMITAFIDGSAIYGSDEPRANWLRTFSNGKLKVSKGNNLPWNTTTGEFNGTIDPNVPFMDNGGGLTAKFYVAGDVRANENPLLVSMHTIFVREHNLVCDELKLTNPSWNDEQIYQFARKIVSGKLQAIIYNEWLPTINVHLPKYSGYIAQVNPSIYNVFSAAAFRMGHTLINSNLIRMKNDGEIFATGNIALKDAFFNPISVELSGGIEPFVKGMGTQIQQDFDCKVINDVRNFLFGLPGQGGLDLAAININRGRERGLPDYNTVRSDFGLAKINKFDVLCSEPSVAALLQEIYGNINDIDPWVGMLAEDHLPDGLFGELVTKILERQFRALRDGDRFFFENDSEISANLKSSIRNTTLNNLIMRNTNIRLMQTNVFKALDHKDIPNGPEVDAVNLNFEMFPNPLQDHFYLKMFSDTDQDVIFKIYDINGATIQEGVLPTNQGENTFLINIDENIEVGVYNIYLESGINYSIKRFVKI